MNYTLMGIYLTLFIYHFLVFLGRKSDKTNFYFALVNLSAALIIFSEKIFPHLSGSYLFWAPVLRISVFMLITWSYSLFFIHFLEQKQFLSIIYKIIPYWGIFCSLSIFLYFFLHQEMFLIIPVYGITTLLGITALVFALKYYYLKRKALTSRLKLGFYLFLITLTPNLFSGICISLGIESPVWIFPVITVVCNFVIAFVMVGIFNREHKDLVILKENLEMKVNERTLSLEREKESKKNFFSGFMHKIAVPIISIAEHLDEYTACHRVQSDLTIVKSNVDKLQRNINNFMDGEKLDKGLFQFNNVTCFSLSRYVEDTIALFSAWGERKQVCVSGQIESSVFINVDPAALDHIINNLLDNALKFTLPGGSVELILEKQGDKAVLKVRDTGVGIPGHRLNDIFTPFVQLSGNRQHPGEGIGMGLFIVKKIVDNLHGSITVESEEGKGTVFTVVLAMADHPPHQELIVQNKNALLLKNNFRNTVDENQLTDCIHDPKKANILFVEDNIELLLLIKSVIGKNINFYYALNGEHGLEKLTSIPVPAIIVSDVMMDKMDGFDFFNAIREEYPYRSIPFIFLTARSVPEEKTKAFLSGAIDYITKPFSIDELELKLNALLKNLKKQKERTYSELKKQVTAFIDHNYTDTDGENNRASVLETRCLKYRFSRRETEIALLLVKGLTSKAMAAQLFISEKTIATHIQRLLQKTGAGNRAEFMRILLSD